MKKSIVWLSCIVLVLVSLLGCGNTQTEESVDTQTEGDSLAYIYVQNPKTTYAVGEEIDLAELAIVAVYSDGKTETITSGFTCIPTAFTTDGSQTVIVNYAGKTTSFNVTVTTSGSDESEEPTPVGSESEETATTEESDTGESVTVMESEESAESQSQHIHTKVVDAAIDASCTTSGKTEGIHCSTCGEIIKAQEEIQPLGHDYVETVIAPTATTDGYTEHICSRCNDSYRDSITPATGTVITFSDPWLEYYIKQSLGVSQDKSLTDKDLLKLTSFSVLSAVKDISDLKYAKNLSSISFTEQADPLGLAVLKELPIVSYSVDCGGGYWPTNAADVQFIKSLTQISNLSLKNAPSITIDNVKELVAMPSLRSFSFSMMTWSGIDFLSCANHIESLTFFLPSVGYVDEDISILESMPYLKSLEAGWYPTDNQRAVLLRLIQKGVNVTWWEY